MRGTVLLIEGTKPRSHMVQVQLAMKEFEEWHWTVSKFATNYSGTIKYNEGLCLLINCKIMLWATVIKKITFTSTQGSSSDVLSNKSSFQTCYTHFFSSSYLKRYSTLLFIENSNNSEDFARNVREYCICTFFLLSPVGIVREGGNPQLLQTFVGLL